MAIDPSVIQQINYDASVGGRNLAQNPFQRAQTFLRGKLGFNPPDPRIKLTSAQQANADAKTGGRARRAYESKRPKTKVHPDVKNVGDAVRNVGGIVGNLTGKGLAISAAAVPGEDQTMKWRRLGYPSPEAYQAKVRGDEHKLSVDGVMYDTRNEEHMRMMNSSIDKTIAAQHKALKESKGDGDGSNGRGRELTTKKNIYGVEQRGAVLSPMAGANQMLENLGVTTQRYGKFQSNDLPGSTYSAINKESLSQIYDPDTLHEFNSEVNQLKLSDDLFIDGSGLKGEKSFYSQGLENVYGGDANSINMLQAEGAPFLIRNGDFPITSILESQNKNGTRARYDEEFLNSGDNPMAGLRAAERSKGLLYASGQHWYENPEYQQEGQDEFLKITKEQFNNIKNSDMSAQDFFANKLAGIKGE